MSTKETAGNLTSVHMKTQSINYMAEQSFELVSFTSNANIFSWHVP